MFMRKMKNLPFMISPFYFGLFSSVVSIPIALYQISRQGHPTEYNWQGILILIAMSFSGVLGQMAVSRAYQLEKAGRVAPINNIQLVLNVLFDLVIMGSSLTTQEIIGGAIILGCNLIIGILKCQGVIT